MSGGKNAVVNRLMLCVGGGVAGNWRSYADSASLHTTRENDSQTDCGALIWALVDKPGWDCDYYWIPYNRRQATGLLYAVV